MRILVTSGGTKIPIDLVRSITNMSKGTFGSDICKSFLEKGHDVDFLMADGSKTPFKLDLYATSISDTGGQGIQSKYNKWVNFVRSYGFLYDEYKYKTFEDYKSQIETLLSANKYDIVILAAAVSDFGVENVVKGKIRSKEDLNIVLKPLPKIISEIKRVQPNTFLVGFKLLVDSTEKALIYESERSIENNGCDLVVANDLRDIKADNHKLLVVSKVKGEDGRHITVKKFEKNEAELYGVMLAEMLVDRILDTHKRSNNII